MDNLEHLLDETQLLARMLSVAPGLRLLATTRIPLRLYGEHTVRVPPLHLPGAGRARRQRGGPAVHRAGPGRAPGLRPGRETSLPPSAEICAALDGLPLAIELAAAGSGCTRRGRCCRCCGPAWRLLTGGPRDLPRLQQTLRAALDWSHALLPPGTRSLFACLGVFAGPSTPRPRLRSARNPIRPGRSSTWPTWPTRACWR